MLTSLLMAFVTFGILVYICLYFFSPNFKHESHMEVPGPWGLPILGHLLFLGKNPAMTFMKWSKIYGPIVSVRFGGSPAVILNDRKIIKEAFKLDVFSGRAPLRNLLNATKNKGIGFAEGPRQLEQRKFSMKILKTKEFSKSDLEFKVADEILIFLRELQIQCRNSFAITTKPQKLAIHHFFRFPILNSLYESLLGHRFNENDPKMEHLFQSIERFSDTNSSLVMKLSWYLPWVSNVLTYFKLNTVVSALDTIYNFMGDQIEESRKNNYIPGQANNFTHAYFDQVSQTTNPESGFFKGREQRFTTGELLIAAADTTAASLDWLLLYMAKEPHIQQKLQEEIDDIDTQRIGINGKPKNFSLSDRNKMPYTDAVISELLRISSVGPLGIFHRSYEQVSFHGYRIPKGTWIIANLYGIHHDPDIWAEPDSFQPERFLIKNVENSSTEKKPAWLILPFSTGKRNCIGEGFARDQLFLITTNFFRNFTVACTDKIPSLELQFGMVVSPLPFELIISERNISSS